MRGFFSVVALGAVLAMGWLEARGQVSGLGALALLGSWQAEDGTVLEFTADGKFVFGRQSAPYRAAGGKVTFVGPAGSITWGYSVDGEQLVLDMDGNKQVLRRPAASNKTEVEAGREKPQNAAEGGGVVGVWRAADGDQIEIRSDAIVYGGTTLPAVVAGSEVRVTGQGGQVQRWPYRVSGDTLDITIGVTRMSLQRAGGVARARKGEGAREPAGNKTGEAGETADAPRDARGARQVLVGTWSGPEGSVIVRDNGTMRTGGKEVRWQIDESAITLTDENGGWLKIPYRFETRDKLVLGTGPTQTLLRNKSGVAGVWVAQESSMNAQFYMGITQYLTLYPDGSVGFTKSEGGASRRQVSECIEQFSSFSQSQGDRRRTYGRWRADGGTITIQWQGAFNNATWQGQIDPRTSKLVIPRAGILEQGATLSYERQ